MRLILILAPLLLAAQCVRQPVDPPRPDPPLVVEPVPVPVPAHDCTSACARASELGCSIALATEKGGSCVDVCEHVNSSGTLRLDTECATLALSCNEAEGCVTIVNHQ